MSFRISARDTPAVARAKLLYIVPFYLAVLLPGLLYVGWLECGWASLRSLWRVLRYGRP